MTGLKQTIAKLFATATETGTVEQVSAQAVVDATEVDTTDDSTDAVPTAPEEQPTEETTVVETSTEPTPEAAVTLAAAPSAQVATMAQIEVGALASLQQKAEAYDDIQAEHAQLKAWHTAAQGSTGLGPDANMATEAKPKHVSAATQRAIEIAEQQAQYAS